MKRVLFICGQNRLRSPTAEQLFSSWPGIEVTSAGLNHDAENPVTPELLTWADLIFVMEKTHRNRLPRRFRQYLNSVRIVCLNIPDEYEYMDPPLVHLLRDRVSPFLPKM